MTSWRRFSPALPPIKMRLPWPDPHSYARSDSSHCREWRLRWPRWIETDCNDLQRSHGRMFTTGARRSATIASAAASLHGPAGCESKLADTGQHAAGAILTRLDGHTPSSPHLISTVPNNLLWAECRDCTGLIWDGRCRTVRPWSRIRDRNHPA